MDHPSNYFLRTIPLLQVYVRASVGLFARTYRPSEPPNDGAMARESALAVPPLSPAHHQIQQLWAAPLRARQSLLPLRPSLSSLCLPLSPSLPSVISRRVAATEWSKPRSSILSTNSCSSSGYLQQTLQRIELWESWIHLWPRPPQSACPIGKVRWDLKVQVSARRFFELT